MTYPDDLTGGNRMPDINRAERAESEVERLRLKLKDRGLSNEDFSRYVNAVREDRDRKLLLEFAAWCTSPDGGGLIQDVEFQVDDEMIDAFLAQRGEK